MNTYTTSFQVLPRVAASDAGFVVVWWGVGSEDPRGIFGQRFDAFGSKVGSEFHVNEGTSTVEPSVAMDAAGNFVVVWTGLDGSYAGIRARRFSSAGAPIGSEFPVNTYTTGPQTGPSVAMTPGGAFVVAWVSDGQDGAGAGIFGQRFDAAGANAGSEFPVNTAATGTQRFPSVAISDAGSFVVAWTDGGYGENPDGDGYGVFAQRFDAAGARAGTQFLVNTYTTSSQRQGAIGMDPKGNFVVVWEGDQQEASFDGVYGQRFDAAGARLGAEFHVNTYTTSRQEAPAVAVARSGDFLVTWQSRSEDGSQFGVFARQFDHAGNALDGEFPVNTYTTGIQWAARAAASSSGFTIVWQSDGQDGSDYGIFGRRQSVVPVGVQVDASATAETSSDGNGVLEPGESVLVAPLWANRASGAADLSGSIPLTFCFIGSPCVAAGDLSASYGIVPAGALGSCNDGSDDACYTVGTSGPRPGTHWDGEIIENMSVGGSKIWTLHVGDSFTDIPRSQPFYKKIETILHHGITSGCNATQYCPGNSVPRDQMSIFIAKAMAGSGGNVPASGTLTGVPFGSQYNCTAGGASLLIDVTPTDSFCKHAHYLASHNVTAGCGNFKYCPSQLVTRDAMASFIAKALVSPAGGNAIPASYTDPGTHRSYSCVAGSANIHFTDVPVSNAFCKHIHYLWAKGVVDGCSATQYCPAAAVARDAMAKFIANGFGLQLYGP